MGGRFFDILLLDALYTRAPCSNGTPDRLGIGDQSETELPRFVPIRGPPVPSRPPDSRFSEQREGKTYEVQLWDTEALLFSSTIPPRFVSCAPKSGSRAINPPPRLPPSSPQEIGPAGDRQPVPNRGLAAVGLIVLVAFALCSALALQHSKLVRRCGLTPGPWRASCIVVCPRLRRPSGPPADSATPSPAARPRWLPFRLSGTSSRPSPHFGFPRPSRRFTELPLRVSLQPIATSAPTFSVDRRNAPRRRCEVPVCPAAARDFPARIC